MYRFKRCLLFGALVLALSACGEGTGTLRVTNEGLDSAPQIGQASEVEQAVDFDIQFSALLNDTSSAETGVVRTTSAVELASQIFQGNLIAENIDTGEVQTDPVMVHIENGFAGSLSTLQFNPGRYNFTFSFSRGDQFYIGQDYMEVLEFGNNAVPVVVRPVLGNSTIDVDIQTLVSIQYTIAPEQLSSVGFTDTELQVMLDDEFNLFSINPDTGVSNQMWLNVEPGEHTISFDLFDRGQPVGSSPTEQQTVNITDADNLLFDIVPLYGTVEYDLIVENGDATIKINVPADVVEVAGSLSNLESSFSIAAAGGTNYFSTPLNLVAEGDVYVGDIYIPEINYQLHTFDITFRDIAKDKQIGNCFEENVLTSGGVTMNCEMVLQRESNFDVSLSSAVAVNVFDSMGYPLPGATVSVDGEAVGLTGDTSNSPGYSAIFVRPGQHIIRAEFGGEYGEVKYFSESLNAASVNVILGQTINNSDPPVFEEDFVVEPGIGYAPDPGEGFWHGCASANGSPVVVVEEDFSRLVLPSYASDCSANSALTELDFSHQEIEAAGGFEVSVDLAGPVGQQAEFSIGFGEELGADPLSFTPSDSADAVVTFREQEIEINLFEAGVSTGTITRPTPFTMLAIDNIKLDVELQTMLPGESGNLSITINGSQIDTVPFTWDGGSNHIELRGSAAQGFDGIVKVYVDRLTVRPR